MSMEVVELEDGPSLQPTLDNLEKRFDLHESSVYTKQIHANESPSIRARTESLMPWQ